MNKKELISEYERIMKYYKGHGIKRPFDKYAEIFWILFDDGTKSYTWAIDTLCELFPECNRQELEKTLDKYI